MTLTLKDVSRQISPYEPNWNEIAGRFGPKAVPYLARLAAGTDVFLAARAVTLASFLDVSGSSEIVAIGARRPEDHVRMAAAIALGRISNFDEKIAVSLLADENPGVRKWVLKSLTQARARSLRRHVQRVAKSDSEPFLRRLAAEVIKQPRT